jgi:hypothetical protein
MPCASLEVFACFRGRFCLAFCKLRFCIALRKCAASIMPTFAQGDSSQAIRPAHALPIPLRYTPRYRIANLPAVSPLPARLRAFYGHPRAMFYYRLLLFISCYYVARHNINGLRKLGNARHGSAWNHGARQGKASTPRRTTQDKPHPLPSPPHGERGRQAAAPHATRGRGRGTWHGAAG